MSHVDEGTLHTYLDGELPPGERAALEAHVAQCASCRTRLADERALLERSTALLASARPVERPAPPFEQVRRAPRRPWYLRTSAAWAASIVLAIGIGYYLGDANGLLRAPGAKLVDSAAAGSMARESIPAAPPQVASRSAAPPARTAPALRAGRRAQQEERSERIGLTQEQDEVSRRDSTVAGVVAVEPSVQLRNATPAPESAAGMKIDGAQSGVVSIRGRELTTQWKIISRGTATTLLGTDPVGLRGLRTRSIRRSPSPDATVVVEQALDSSTTIQIFQRPVTEQATAERAARDAAPAAATPALPPADRLARFVGRLRVEISGPLTADSLNKLLEQVEPLPY